MKIAGSALRRVAVAVIAMMIAFGQPAVMPRATSARPKSADKSVPPAEVEMAIGSRVIESYGRLPLSFEANRGQADARVKFLARGSGYGLFLTPTEAILKWRSAEGGRLNEESTVINPPSTARHPPAGMLRLRLAGANPAPQVEGLYELPGKSHYFIGNKPEQWRTNVPTYARVRCLAVYPGVDMVYYGHQRQLEYDLIVSPGARPGVIKLRFDGAARMRLDANGDLAMRTAGGEARLRRPVIYQEVNGQRRIIAGRYIIKGKHVGFRVAAYDTSRPLVIDPVISYFTLGSKGIAKFSGIVADAAGAIYVSGTTTALDFPTANPIQGQRGDSGDGDAFVTKLNATGTALVYSTYLGGSSREEGNGLAVDPAGNAYVVGTTLSTDFPTANPLQATRKGSIYKSADGGNSWTASHNGLPTVNIRTLAISRTNPAVLYAGSDRLQNGGGNKLPAGGVYKSADGGSNWKAVNTGLPPDSQIKVLAVDPTNAAVVYAGVYNSSGVLGGVYKSADGGGSWRHTLLLNNIAALAIDPNNPATLYAAGIAFVAKSMDGGDSWRINRAGFDSVTALGIDPTDSTKVYAGDSQSNFYKSADGGATWSLSKPCLRHPVNALAIDPQTPTTLYLGTTDFETPHTFGDSIYKSADGGGSWCAVRAHLPRHRVYALAIDPSTPATLYAGAYDGVFKSADGGDNWSATRSGLPDTQVNALVVDPTSPTTLYAGLRGNADVFVAKLSASGSALVYSTYLGGSADDQGRGIAVDTEGNAYLTGETLSLDFPTTPGAFQPVGAVNHFRDGCDNCLASDAFIVKMNAAGTALVYSTYIGGGGPERGIAIAVDAAGAAYVAGAPYGFVMKLNAAGSALAYSTRLNFDDVNGIAVDSAGNAFVLSTVGISDVYSTLIQSEVIVTKLNVTGTAYDYFIYLGGSGDDYGAGIAVDSQGNAYVTGVTLSSDFPTSPGAFQSGPGIFLTKLNGTGKALFYSTTLNGGHSGGVALDSVGNVYLAGEDSSSTFIAKINLSDNRASGERLENVSAASFLSAPRILASESIVAAFGSKLAAASLANSGLPLPTALAGTTVTVKDQAGTERLAPLFYVSPSQINYQVPPGTQAGNVIVIVTNSEGVFSFESVGIASVQPGLFAANGNGQGVAAAVALRFKANGAQIYEPVARFDQASSRHVAAPIDLGAETDQVFLVLYGTGWRFRSSESAVNVRIGGKNCPVLYAGPQPTFVGLDQINALLPRTLIGSGEVDVVVTVDFKTANTVKVRIL